MNANRKALVALSLSLSLAGVSFATRARAGDPAAAEALFDEARRLMSQGNYAAACPQLEESQKLDPGMGTLYNLGDCYEKTGRVASAWAAFLDVAAQAKNAGQSAREADARARAAALEPKLSRLTIAVEGPAALVPGLEVKRDGSVVVGKAQWGLALPIDPGPHRIDATAPGKKSWSGNVDVAQNASQVRLVVPALEDAPAPVASTPAPAPVPAPAPGPAPEEPRSGQAQRTLGLVATGVGVVGMGIGGVFGLKSMSNKSDADKHCDARNACDAEGLSLRKDALSAGNLSTVFFVAGGVVAAAGVVLYVTAPKDASRAVAIAPAVTSSGGGLFLNGSFR